MSKGEFERRMAVWLKGKEFSTETNMDGNIVIWPKNGKEKICAIVDPEKNEAIYGLDFSEPVVGTYIPIEELDDLRYFVNLLLEND